MFKVRVIESSSAQELEESINKFIENNNINLVDILNITEDKSKLIVCVVYSKQLDTLNE